VTRRLIQCHKGPPPLVSVLSQTNSHHALPSYLRSTLIVSSHLCRGFQSCFFPSGFPTKTLYATLLFAVRATCIAHHILLDLITLTIHFSSTNHEAPNYAISCSWPLSSPSYDTTLDLNEVRSSVQSFKAEWQLFVPLAITLRNYTLSYTLYTVCVCVCVCVSYDCRNKWILFPYTTLTYWF
jgi:hypothetical protein